MQDKLTFSFIKITEERRTNLLMKSTSFFKWTILIAIVTRFPWLVSSFYCLFLFGFTQLVLFLSIFLSCIIMAIKLQLDFLDFREQIIDRFRKIIKKIRVSNFDECIFIMFAWSYLCQLLMFECRIEGGWFLGGAWVLMRMLVRLGTIDYFKGFYFVEFWEKISLHIYKIWIQRIILINQI